MRGLGLVLLLAGCRQLFGLEAPSHAVTDAPGDGEIPDAGRCMAASAECLGTTLRTCSGSGVMPVDTDCRWTCLPANGPHCGELVPAGGGALATDLEPDPLLMDIALGTGALVINGDTGAIGTVASSESIRTAGIGVNNGIGYSVNNGIAVFRFASLSIAADVAPIGSHAIALVAAGTVDVSGLISMQATCVAGGGTLGGSAGGASGTTAAGSGGGVGAPAPTDGGGGGGYGGTGGLGAGNIAGGSRYGNPPIALLVGGGGGGGGGGAAPGGGGGGAIQLASNTRISITGGINAGGCGGHSAQGSISGAGGGGAGGTILLEAPQISIAGKLAVNGGGGGGVGTTTNGTNGTLDRTPAPGGAGNGNGGPGAAASMLDGGAYTGIEGGGGGGGIGRIRLNTRTGVADVLVGSVLSPEPDDPLSTCTQGSASVQ